MSQIALSPNPAGTGTFTIEAPNSNNNRTLTLPDNSGTLITNTAGSVTQSMLASNVAGNGPAFSAFAPTNNQNVSNTVFTKIQFSSEEFDIGSCYDSATNYRFTPNVAGYYQLNAAVGVGSNASGLWLVTFFKNGNRFRDGTIIPNSNIGPLSVASALIYFNGTTDFVEVYGYQSSGVTLGLSFNTGTAGYFQGSLVRAA